MHRPKATGYATPNGLARTGDGRTMYHSDSHNGIVDAWDFEITQQRRLALPNEPQGESLVLAVDAVASRGERRRRTGS